MKKAIILMVLGVGGLVSYTYFQFSSLAYVADYEVIRDIEGVAVGLNVIYHRDWTLGLVGAIVGVILLGWGIYRLRAYNASKQA